MAIQVNNIQCTLNWDQIWMIIHYGNFSIMNLLQPFIVNYKLFLSHGLQHTDRNTHMQILNYISRNEPTLFAFLFQFLITETKNEEILRLTSQNKSLRFYLCLYFERTFFGSIFEY